MSTSKRKKEQRMQKMKADAVRMKYQKDIDNSKRVRAQREQEFVDYVPTEPYQRATPNHPSLETTEFNTFKAEDKRYTGDYITGIATSHKSNLVPVSRGIDPKDYATMRRG